MSKVNYVGNNFALSNADVMTALKNSSASMAAANATFEETVALITAGQEIAQDSSKVGNALRTISMRIRGMNEETQELDGSLQTIGGDVYDLTNGKVSIMLDPETYKSPYKILQEISHVWDELTDVQHAELAEKLFGKNRANIGIAVIENFKQAEAAMAGMEKSAGAADKEMEIITNSLTYKLNALRETGTGIWQNLFQRESVGGVVDDLTVLLGLVEKFTEKVGLLGTVAGVGGAGSVLFRFFKEWKAMSNAKEPDMSFVNILQRAFPVVNTFTENFSKSMNNGSGALKSFASAAAATASSLMPLIGILAAIGIAVGGFALFDHLNSGWTRAQESAQKAVSEFDDAKTKLEDLNKEKDNNLSKVQEIAAKYDIQVDGMDDVDEIIEKINSSDKGITLVDQVELEKLSSANKQLEAQAKIQEQIVKAKQQAAIAETEEAAQTEKSYWETIKEKHGGGIFGNIAAAWDYLTNNKPVYDENGRYTGKDQEAVFNEADTTNIGLAQKAYDDLIAKKQELQQLNQEIENSKGGVTDEQIKRHEDLTKEIAEQASKAGTLMNTVSSELDVLSQSDSKFAKDYVKQAKQLLLDFSNIDASPAEVALNTINSFFDGTFGKNAIKEELIDAMESGQDLEETLQGLGLSMDDFGNIDISFLTDYFEDITKSAEEAKDTVDNFHVSIDDVSEATKSANKDADWSTMQSAYKAAGELLKEGKTGTDDFQTVAQFFSSDNLQKLAKEAKDAGGYAADVYQKAFEDAKSKADRWFGADETKSMENFVDDMSDKGLFNVNKSDEKGLWDIESQFRTTAEAAKELGTSTEVVETMLSALESYGYDFSGIEKSGEMLSEYQQTLEALKQTYDSMGEGEAKDKLGKMIEEFDTDFGTFKDDLSKLSEEQVIHIKFEYDLASIQSKIDEIQELINGGDNSVENNAQLIAANNQYIKTAEKGLGMNLEGIQMPVEYVVADNTEANLREQLKDATPEEKVEIQTEIENQQQIKKDILDTFADEHPEIHPNITPDSTEEEINKAVEQVNAALDESFGEKTIKFNASLDGVEQELQAHQNEDGTITYTANVDGVQTEVQEVKNEDGTITYTTKIEGEEKIEEVASDKKSTITANVQVNGAEKVSSATAGANDKNVSVNAKVTGTDNVNNLASAINNAPSSKSIPVTANVSGKGDVDSLASAIRGMPSSKTSYVNVVHTTINKTVNAVDGTAHARGTAFSKGTARKGVSFAGGNWGTKSSGVALVGEENPEILVRNGRWQLIGENSAEFVAYKKGDIELCPHTAMCA